VIEKLGSVNLRIKRSPRANPMVVHVDKIKHCTGTTPASWLGIDDYQVLPSGLEPDALPNMFGGVDRSSPCDTDTGLATRPKKNAAIPARFLSHVFAVPIDVCLSHSLVSGGQRGDMVNNDVMCLYFISTMKKTGYVCFPCWKESGRDRLYSRSYDVIAHMVNAHGKYPEGIYKRGYLQTGPFIRPTAQTCVMQPKKSWCDIAMLTNIVARDSRRNPRRASLARVIRLYRR